MFDKILYEIFSLLAVIFLILSSICLIIIVVMPLSILGTMYIILDELKEWFNNRVNRE